MVSAGVSAAGEAGDLADGLADLAAEAAAAFLAEAAAEAAEAFLAEAAVEAAAAPVESEESFNPPGQAISAGPQARSSVPIVVLSMAAMG